MFDFPTHLLSLAEAAEPAAGGGNIWSVMLPYLAFIAVLYFVMSGPQRREQSKRDAALKAIKKNDRVITIGGIYGTVANVSADGDEITLKVDDNVKIRFRKSAIANVLGDETSSQESPPKSS